MSKLSSALALNKYILQQFGATTFEQLAADLRNPELEGCDSNGISHIHHRLVEKMYTSKGNLDKDRLLEYDQNIVAHTRALSASGRREPIRWKYFQYLSLLFTEYYLDRYFREKEGFCNDLNDFLVDFNAFQKEKGLVLEPFSVVPDKDDNCLNKLAFWNATGSGKTLLMHINILQYRHYLKKYNQENALNRIIVLTPNEGLSKQHLEEFYLSGLDAQIFQKGGGTMFQGRYIEIIEITKISDNTKVSKDGKSVTLEKFEANNLVMVDEGHRGSSSNSDDKDKDKDKVSSWRDKRAALSVEGFSFEYSATFGQAVSASKGKNQTKLLAEYGKSTIFDYSYRYFYNDGYGKDYNIMNINDTWNDHFVKQYLTASLLTFYEQINVFSSNNLMKNAFLLEKPLMIFVGSSVNAVRTESKKEVSDVVAILQFIEWFVHKPTESIEMLNRLIAAEDGLLDAKNIPVFGNAFGFIKKKKPEGKAIYQQILKEVFNSSGSEGARLHLDNLKGQQGEIGLRVGDADYFGVINVGDDKKLLDLCKTNGLLTDDKDFAVSLFRKINDKNSKVNLLIGSKKFTEGWSSWRVSCMGLMNIGRGEGSEIIQLFGRGVRLKGLGFSLKRSTHLSEAERNGIEKPLFVEKVETLNIFGIRADYMKEFEKYLEDEGVDAGKSEDKYTTIELPTIFPTVNLDDKKLKYIEFPDGRDFKKEKRVALEGAIGQGRGDKDFVRLDWYPRVQIKRSGKNKEIIPLDNQEEHQLSAAHLAFFDWEQVYFELQFYKSERAWHNVAIDKNQLETLLLQGENWYKLHIPEGELAFDNFEKIRTWQEIGTILLKKYMDRRFNYVKSEFIAQNAVSKVLDASHPNFEKVYKVAVEKSQTNIIEKVNELKQLIENKAFIKDFEVQHNVFKAIHFDNQLFEPLLWLAPKYIGSEEKSIKIEPVQLNDSEQSFVLQLRDFVQKGTDFFKDKELYLLRNKSRKGIGFFEANNFYPDFLLWLVIGKKQYLSFIDPKGLRQVAGFEDPKLKFYDTVKNIEQRIGDKDFHLSSFIVTPTKMEELKHWRGGETLQGFNDKNVYFQTQGEYVKTVLEKMTK